jgi:putative glutamine amidotransferase
MSRQTRPLIGINTDYIPPGRTAGAQLKAHAGYCESVYASGGLPILIPPLLKEAELDDLLERLDGVVLTGSPLDMDPRRMGLSQHPAVDPMPSIREEADRMLCRLVIQRQMPLLAIAVGMHELNVLSGGTLFMHLPEDLPRAFPHKDPSGGPHRHAVLLEPNTRLDLIYGGGEIRVNSYHHQAVQQVAPGFRVGALAPDGVIEAIETDDPNWFCIGVQWHPHSETASALDMQLFEAFVQACAQKEVILQLAA